MGAFGQRTRQYGDIYGLILRVQPSGSKAWIWRGTVNVRRRDLGLGRYPFVSLAEAREKAFEYRKAALEGSDHTLLRSGGIPTFATATEAVIALHAGKWNPGRQVRGAVVIVVVHLRAAGYRLQTCG